MSKPISKSVAKNILWSAVSAALAIATIKVVISQKGVTPLSEVISSMQSSNTVYLVMAFIASAVYVLTEAAALTILLSAGGYNVQKRRGLIYSTADFYFSAITPSASGGQPGAGFFMVRDGISAGTASSTIILNLTLHNAATVALGLLAVLLQPQSFISFSPYSQTLIILGFIALIIFTLILALLHKKSGAVITPAERFIEFLYNKKMIKEKNRKYAKLEKLRNDYRNCSELISGKRDVVINVFLLNTLQRIAQTSVPMLIYKALGGEGREMLHVFVKQCLITVGYNFVPVPGGIGVSDYLMIDGFSYLMSDSMAYSVELISRGISFYFVVAACGIITLIGYFTAKKQSVSQ